MKSLHIRDVPIPTIVALKRLARANHRSLQGELREILEHAARLAPPDEPPGDLDLVTVRAEVQGEWNREMIYGDNGR